LTVEYSVYIGVLFFSLPVSFPVVAFVAAFVVAFVVVCVVVVVVFVCGAAVCRCRRYRNRIVSVVKRRRKRRSIFLSFLSLSLSLCVGLWCGWVVLCGARSAEWGVWSGGERRGKGRGGSRCQYRRVDGKERERTTSKVCERKRRMTRFFLEGRIVE